ncbi:MAG: zinc ribbon domain-containing protein [Brumimicrobium sp.]|nr:zinc ribbon domain-containing protein [Brumimicrobium sp.]
MEEEKIITCHKCKGLNPSGYSLCRFCGTYLETYNPKDNLNNLRERYNNYESQMLISIVNDKSGDYTKEAIAIAKEILDERLYVYCKSCGLKMPSNYQFCNNCGTKIIKKRTCNKCNFVFELDGNFCPNCGNAV